MSAEEKLNQFLEEVCSYIKCRAVHDDVALELRGHVDDRVDFYTAQGMSYCDAVDRALKDMGGPDEIGRGLHKAHRPQTDWLFLSMLGVYVGVTVLTMLSIYGSETFNNPLYHGVLSRKLVSIVLGLGLAIGVTWFDYRLIRHFSRYVLWGTVLLMIFTLAHGTNMLGRTYLEGIPVDILGLSPFLLLIGLTGMVDGLHLRKSKDFLQFIALAIVPTWLFLKHYTFANGMEYTVGFLALMLATPSKRKNKGVIFASVALVIASFCVPLTLQAGSLMSLKAYLHPELYAQSLSYQYIQGRQALTAAGAWGHGLYASLPSVPGIQGDMVFNYIVYAFGWVIGLAIIALVMTVLARVLWMIRKTPDMYGRQVIISLGAVLAIQFIYPVLTALGIVPQAGIGFPLAGTDSWVTIMEFTCLGVIQSVYRKRRIVRTVSSVSNARTHVE